MTTVRSRPGTMTTMIASIIVGGASLILATTLPSSIALACGHFDAPEEPRLIQVAICLDTSGSMDGLIDAARQKLWAIVNDLALAKPTPRLEVALLTYGNDGHKEADGWVAVQSPLTSDLDLISQQLFALTTNGGTEFVGRVLHRAGDLQWHPSDDTVKLVIVAGNESADQDEQMPFPDECKTLITRGIMIDSIYCGPAEDDIAQNWRRVAQLADGHFASIDHNQGTVVIDTPFDAQLGALSAALNATYIPLGSAGQSGLVNQAIQDANAAKLNSAAAAERCSTKGGALYRCGWDLVDASTAEDFDLATIKTEDLPAAMQSMTIEQRGAHVEAMREQRAEIQQQIADLSAQRQVFLADQMKQQELVDADAFDAAVRAAVRSQCAAKGYTFE